MAVNDDAVGRSIDEALRLIQAFQYADENGVVCPANWKPGDKVIKPDQEQKLEYFEDAYEAKSKYPEQEPEDETIFSVTKLNEGTPGGELAPKGKMIEMHYTGKLLDGTVFDSSVTRGQTFKFKLGVGQVIKCWD